MRRLRHSHIGRQRGAAQHRSSTPRRCFRSERRVTAGGGCPRTRHSLLRSLHVGGDLVVGRRRHASYRPTHRRWWRHMSRSAESTTSKPSRPARVLLLGVRGYRRIFAGRPSPCRYLPTCSGYALDALEMHGALRGSWMTVRRIGRCRPGGGSGFDPVPDRIPSCASDHLHDQPKRRLRNTSPRRRSRSADEFTGTTNHPRRAS